MAKLIKEKMNGMLKHVIIGIISIRGRSGY